MKQIHFILLVFALSIGSLKAQFKSVDDVRTINLKDISLISDKNGIQGYSIFYQVDKTGKKEFLYRLQILDDNLEIVHSLDIVKPDNYVFIESGFDGSHFCFAFFTGTNVEHLIYDVKGNLTGTYKGGKLSMYQKLMVEASLRNPETNQFKGIQGVPGTGFLIMESDTEQGAVFSVCKLIDYSGKKIWGTKPSNATDKKVRISVINHIDDKIIAFLNVEKKDMMGMDFDYSMSLFNPKNGKKITDIKVGDDKYFIQLSTFEFNPETNNYKVAGSYSSVNGSIKKMKPLGLYMAEMDVKGKFTQEVYSPWKNGFSEILELNPEGNFQEDVVIVPRYGHKDAKGHLNMVFELYRKLKNFSLNTQKVEIIDLVVMQFDQQNQFVASKIVRNQPRMISMPVNPGGTADIFTTANLLNMNYFNFLYLTPNQKRDGFSILYTDYDKMSSEKKEPYVLGAMVKDASGNWTSDQLTFDRTSTHLLVLPAKSGYVALFEYFKKEKKFSYRLERLNI